jgi:hypothetical protein
MAPPANLSITEELGMIWARETWAYMEKGACTGLGGGEVNNFYPPL